MDRNALLAAADALIKRVAGLNDQRRQLPSGQLFPSQGAKAEVCEFLRSYAGPKNSFFLQASALEGGAHSVLLELQSILEAFRDYVVAGLQADMSPERRAQLDVVTDLLEQAARLLDDKGVHPVAPAMLIGATLEEFLRTWVEAVPLTLGARTPGIQAYSELLRGADLISKQDVKDLISWAGVRNHAAHGEWEEVSDKVRIQLMLEGVNLFMRRYGA